MSELALSEEVDVYAVGGFVRDRLLKRPFQGEIDFAVVGNAPEFAVAFAKAFGLRRRVQVYRRFGTASLPLDNISLEFAATRRESYSPDSRNPDVSPATFEEDLARRDFTFNALAVDVRNPGKIIDLFHGVRDLKAGIVRTPLDPETTFRDDPLRILRAIRFAARLGFTIEKKTLVALQQQRERLEIVARERISDEFFKILAANPPSRGLLMLHETGVLGVIFPEIDALRGVDQVGKHHHKDVLLHTFQVVDKVAEQTPRVDLRFAALVHDIGKPATKRFDRESGWTFHGHEHVGERMVRRMGERYKLAEELIQKTARLVRLHMRPINLQDEEVADSAIRRLAVQAGEQREDLLLVCRADITSGNHQKVRRYLRDFDRMVARMKEIDQKDQLRAFQSPIRGDELMQRTGLAEGPRIGLIKALIEEAILEGQIAHSREAAETILQETTDKVARMEDLRVLETLRGIMCARAEGSAPPPPPESA
ncbi:MAG: HD domain-containing protein [bacterium]